MRTDHQTAPIRQADTGQILRWPSSNDLDEQLPSNNLVESSPLPSHPAPAPLRASSGRVIPDPRRHAPIPSVGDLWGLDHPDPVHVAALRPPLPVYSPPRLRRTGAPAASAALALALVSLPLVLAFGVGAVTGLIAIMLGAIGIGQVRRQPQRYRGTGRSVTAIILGTGSVICGAPFLFLTLLLAGL